MKDLKLDSWRLASMDPIGRAIDNDDLLLDGNDLKRLLDFIKEKRKKSKLKIMFITKLATKLTTKD